MRWKYRLAVVAWVVLATATCSCRSSAEAKKSSSSTPGVEMSLSGGVRFIEVTNGVKRWDISSERADYATGTGILTLSPVKAEYYEEGTLKYKVSAKEGVYDSKREILNLRGGIFAESDNGYTLKTDALEYRLKERIAVSDDYFEVLGKGLELFGTGLNADFERGIFNVLDGVKLKAMPSQLPK